MKVWAFNQPGEEAIEFVYDSISKGYSRFGWSYIDSADLNTLYDTAWADMSDSETHCYNKASFLLDIKPNDWIVHINVPEWGKCTTVQVIGHYSFDKKRNNLGKEYTDKGDYRHTIEVNPKTKITFDRNDNNILPNISRRLKLQGNHWRIYYVDDFLKSITNYKNNNVNLAENETTGLYYLKQDIEPFLNDITKMIHKNHPSKNLEIFVKDLFKNIPNVNEVKLNGFGWGTDHGADIIVNYQSGLPISGLSKEETLVVQVKSFSDVHYDLEAVSQIKTAIKKFKANMGMIITTAQKSNSLEKAIAKLSKELETPIVLIAGEDVAKFVFQYGNELLFDI